MIIYLATNLNNGKQYVGKTMFTLEKRWAKHCYDAGYKPRGYFHLAIRKYGIDSFKVEVLKELGTNEEASFYEKFYIKTLNTLAPGGYNLTEGGEGVLGLVRSEEWKRTIAAKRKGTKQSDKTKEKIASANRGRVCSQQSRDKIRMSLTGKRHSPERVAAMKAGRYGKP
jgi:group I intron endonuclease